MPVIATLIASGTSKKKQLLIVFGEMRPMQYSLGVLFIIK